MVGIVEDYDMSVLYHPGKANVVAYFLSRVSMGCFSYVEESKGDLIKYFHRLFRFGVQIEDSSNDGFVIHHNSE